jgi:hypothetical protein
MAVHGGPNVVMDNTIVGHWDAGDKVSYPGSGTTWYDLSGKGNNGTFVNSSEGTLSTEVGGCFDFELSSTHYVQIGSAGSVASSLQLQAHTIEAWINNESYGGTSGIGAIVSSQRDTNVSGISMDTDSRSAHGGGPNTIHYQMGNGSAWTTDGSYGNGASGLVVNGAWAYYAVTWGGNGTYKYIYKNGVQGAHEGSHSMTISFTSTDWRIGQQPDMSGRLLDGKIALVRIYNRALTPLEINQNYEAQRSRFGI